LGQPLKEATAVKRSSYTASIIALLLCFAGAVYIISAHANAEQNLFTPKTVQWGPPPPFVAPGAEFAVLEGDPTASTGEYTIRLKMPDGYRIAPHWHPLRENVTVISGSFKVGMGDEFEASKMETLPPGSFVYLDPNMHHYAMALGETVVQVHGKSPVKFNYLNPNDDPSRNH
jgi:quercetin dioxygenase-like cupin family protein